MKTSASGQQGRILDSKRLLRLVMKQGKLPSDIAAAVSIASQANNWIEVCSDVILDRLAMQIHPDHFSAHPLIQKTNSDSLKLLNTYVAEIAEGRRIREAVRLEFHVKGGGEFASGETGGSSQRLHGVAALRFTPSAGDGGGMRQVAVQLPAKGGSLLPLFRAFDLVGEGEADAWLTGGEDDDEDAVAAAVTMQVCVGELCLGA